MDKQFDIQRIKNAIQWLIFEGRVANRRELAEKLGYGESYFSQIMTGKVPLSESFIKKLSNFDNRLNYDWLINQAEEMLSTSQIVCGDHNTSIAGNSNNITQSNQPNGVVEKFIGLLEKKDEQLAKSQEQIDRLIGLLENSK